MSGADAVDRFLSRWSRRKIKARGDDGASDGAPDGEPDGEPRPASPPVAVPPATPLSGTDENAAPSSPGAPLPPVEELRGLESKYRDFLRPEVDESLRRTALKKLFQDPHFNVMDGLDTYIDDYTKADPIPEAMLRGLNQARGLLFDREDEQGAVEEPRDAADAAERPSLVTEAVTEEVTEEGTKPSSPEEKEDGNPSQSGPDTPSATT
jgi:hypothetical protein